MVYLRSHRTNVAFLKGPRHLHSLQSLRTATWPSGGKRRSYLLTDIGWRLTLLYCLNIDHVFHCLAVTDRTGQSYRETSSYLKNVIQKEYKKLEGKPYTMQHMPHLLTTAILKIIINWTKRTIFYLYVVPKNTLDNLTSDFTFSETCYWITRLWTSPYVFLDQVIWLYQELICLVATFSAVYTVQLDNTKCQPKRPHYSFSTSPFCTTLPYKSKLNRTLKKKKAILQH